MAADLTDARKLAKRAQAQFDALKTEVDTFLDKRPWHVEVARKGNVDQVRARIPKEPPEDWWIDLGQSAGNARSALDHLVLQLVIDSGNDPTGRRTQFPIFEVEADYLEGGARSHRERMLSGVASRHREVIDSYQPYEWGSRAAQHPLAILRSLTDRHKHRLRHTGAGFLEEFTIIPIYSDGPKPGIVVQVDVGEEPRIFEDKEPVLESSVRSASEPAMPIRIEVKNEPKFTVIFLGDRAFRFSDLGDVVPKATEIIDRFKRRIVGKRPSSGTSR